jgi:hypothetical protein
MARITLLLCAAVLAGLPAHAQNGARAKTAPKFAIDFPAGWAQTRDGENIEARAPESAGEAWCRANSHDLPSLANKTQDGLNAEFATPWDVATWADVLTVEKDKILAFEATSKITDGHVVQEVTLVMLESIFGKKITGRFSSQVLVGRMVNAACFTRSESFDGLKPLFQTTISSLKPVG